METIEFLVQGSAVDPYKITFYKHENKLAAYCTCPAGENGLPCKHRLSILHGNTQGIVSGNESQTSIITEWLPGTTLEEALSAEKSAERDLEHAKTALSIAKKKVAITMMRP